MLATAVIVFREVLEAALIVGIVLAASRGVYQRGVWVSGGIAGGLLPRPGRPAARALPGALGHLAPPRRRQPRRQGPPHARGLCLAPGRDPGRLLPRHGGDHRGGDAPLRRGAATRPSSPLTEASPPSARQVSPRRGIEEACCS